MDLPQGWPPEEPPGAGRVVPMFPLPGVFLFPGMLLPLHVFEPRYRQMVEDSLDGPGRLVLGTVLEGHRHSLAGAPPVLEVAGLGEIARHEKLPDGRFLVWLVGLARCRVREVDSDRLYRRVEVQPLQEVPPDAGEEGALRRELTSALRDRGALPEKVSKTMPLGYLSDLLLMCLQLSQAELEPLYATVAVGERARGALDEHRRRPLPAEPDPEGEEPSAGPGPGSAD